MQPHLFVYKLCLIKCKEKNKDRFKDKAFNALNLEPIFIDKRQWIATSIYYTNIEYVHQQYTFPKKDR